MGKCGRPQEYILLVMALDDNEIYSPRAIATFAERYAFYDASAPHAHRDYRRIRITMGRYQPKTGLVRGDAWYRMHGQSPTPGWFGWRWKQRFGVSS